METSKLEEKYFKTAIVVTIVENYIYGDFTYNELYEFANFITGINIKIGDLHNYKTLIYDKIFDNYPELRDMERINYYAQRSYNNAIIYDRYIKKYGEHMLFKGKMPVVKKQRRLIKKYK